jgi:hypothetical protein
MSVNGYGCNCSSDVTMLLQHICDLRKMVAEQGIRLAALENTPSWFPRPPSPPPSRHGKEYEDPK